MTRTISTSTACLLAFFAIAISSAAPASAVTSTSYFSSDRYPTLYFTIAGDRGPNDVVVKNRGKGNDTYIVSDPDGVNTEDGCRSLSPTKARCSGGFDDFTVRLGGGDDTARVDTGGYGKAVVTAGGGADVVRLTERSASARVFGAEGDDILIGGAGPNGLLGGKGDDELRGGGGADVLLGEDGRDLLRGGDGRDELRSDDSDIDRRTSCGGGDDVAYIDARDPVPARDCETYGEVHHVPKD